MMVRLQEQGNRVARNEGTQRSLGRVPDAPRKKQPPDFGSTDSVTDFGDWPWEHRYTVWPAAFSPQLRLFSASHETARRLQIAHFVGSDRPVAARPLKEGFLV